MIHSKISKKKIIKILGIIISIILGAIGGKMLLNINYNNLQNSPQCNGDNCQQNINYYSNESERYESAGIKSINSTIILSNNTIKGYDKAIDSENSIIYSENNLIEH